MYFTSIQTTAQREHARTFDSPRDGKVQSVGKGPVPARHGDPVDEGGRPAAGQRRKVGGLNQRLLDLVARVRDDRLGERVRRRPLEAGQQPQQVLPKHGGRLGTRIHGRSVDHELTRLVQLEEVGDGRRPPGQRFRLVKHHHVDLGGGFGGLSGLDEDSQLGADAGPHLDRAG